MTRLRTNTLTALFCATAYANLRMAFLVWSVKNWDAQFLLMVAGYLVMVTSVWFGSEKRSVSRTFAYCYLLSLLFLLISSFATLLRVTM